MTELRLGSCSHKPRTAGSLRQAPRGGLACRHLDFRLLASRAVRASKAIVPLCGMWLQWPQGMKPPIALSLMWHYFPRSCSNSGHCYYCPHFTVRLNHNRASVFSSVN